MINDFLHWLGWYADNAFPGVGTFWSQPLGLLISFLMCVISGLNVLHPGIDDGLFDRLYYSALSILFLIAFLIGLSPENPHYLVKTLLIMLTARNAWRLAYRVHQYQKTGIPQKTIQRRK